MENNTNLSQGSEQVQPAVNTNSSNLKKFKEIKCGNCDYIGPGEKNRSLLAVILAWLCLPVAPIVTLIYFIATHTWRCPKCKSTFLGVKNKYGVYAGQMGGGARWVLIFVFVLITIALVGILSSVVLASLNVARIKGSDALVKGGISTLQMESLLYQDQVGSYKGFCNVPRIQETLKKISVSATNNEYGYVCKDNVTNWVASSPLRSGGYWCADDSENLAKSIDTQISTQTSCTEKVSGNNVDSEPISDSLKRV